MSLEARAGSGAERLAAALPLWIVLVANPLGIFRFVADPALLRWWLAAVAILLAIALSRPLRQRMTDRWRDLLPLLGVVLATVLHLAAGAPRAESTRFVGLVIVGVACFAYWRAMDEESQRLGLRLMTLSASVLGVYAVAQALGFDFFHYPSESWMYRVVTTLGHRNFTAVFLLVSLFVALDLREATGGSVAVGRWATVALAPTYVGLLATGARFPILMASVGLLVAARRQRAARTVATALGAALAVWLALIVGRGEVGSVLTRTETFGVRADLYPATGVLALESPFLGQGVGSFSHGIPQELAGRGVGRSPDLVFLHAHNLPAELVVELGALGLLCAAWLPAKVFLSALRRRTGRAWRMGVGGGGGDWLVWALCGWLVTNLYDVNFFTYAGWVSFWPILGVVARRYGSAGASSSAPAEAPRAPVVALCAGLLAVSVLLLPMVASSYLTRRALLAADLGLLDQERRLWLEAESLGPLELEHRYRAAVSRLSPSGPGEEGVRLLEEIESDAPGFSAVRFNVAMGLAGLGRYREALEWIDRHLAAYPGDPRAIEARVALLNRTVGLESLVPDRR